MAAARDAARAAGAGVLVCGVVALASTFISEHLGGPQLLYALLLGMSLNFLSDDARIRPGIDLCARSVLRIGVAMLGARITAKQIGELGWSVGLIVLIGVLSTIGLGLLLARWLRRPLEEGLISGGAVGICGASAAMAVASVLPQRPENERFTLLTVVGVTLLSTVAMVVYPLVSAAAGWEAIDAGVFLGATIHDVAQVVASASMLSPDSAAPVDAATVVKLFRVMLLMPVVIAIALLVRRGAESGSDQSAPVLPGFLIAFIVLVLLNSTQMIPPIWSAHASDASRACLVLAIAGAGLKTHPKDLMKLGWMPIAMLTAETVWLALLVVITKGWWS